MPILISVPPRADPETRTWGWVSSSHIKKRAKPRCDNSNGKERLSHFQITHLITYNKMKNTLKGPAILDPCHTHGSKRTQKTATGVQIKTERYTRGFIFCGSMLMWPRQKVLRPHQNVGGGEKSSCNGEWGGQWKMASCQLLTDLLSSHVSDGRGRVLPSIW